MKGATSEWKEVESYCDRKEKSQKVQIGLRYVVHMGNLNILKLNN